MALDRQTVVRTGLRVLDEVGLDALTLRKISSELGVQPPALYWHFKSKRELIDEMATTLITDSAWTIPAGQPWPEFLTAYGDGLRQMLLRYRDGAKMFAGTALTDTSVYQQQEASLRLLTTAGFTLADAATALSTIYSYTVGFVIEEQAVFPRPGQRDEQYDIARRTERMAGEQVPLSAEAGPVMFDGFDTRFARGLQAIVAGVNTWLPA